LLCSSRTTARRTPSASRTSARTASLGLCSPPMMLTASMWRGVSEQGRSRSTPSLPIWVRLSLGMASPGSGREHGPTAVDEYLRGRTVSMDPGKHLPEVVTSGVRRGGGPGLTSPTRSPICSERARSVSSLDHTPESSVRRRLPCEGHTAWFRWLRVSRWLDAPASITRPAFPDASILDLPVEASAAQTRPDWTRPVPLQPAESEKGHSCQSSSSQQT
jgi:hypothetical protein